MGVVQFNGALNRYVKKFNESLVFEDNGINPGGSGLGAWVNLALIGFALKDKLTDGERKEVEQILGLPLLVAYESVQELINTVPDVVSFAVGCWVTSPDVHPLLKKLLGDVANVEGAVTGSPIPVMSELDKWVEEKTLGLVDQFPADIENAVALLVNTVATKISWVKPFDIDENTNNPWGKSRLIDSTASAVELFEGDQFNYAVYPKLSHSFEDGSHINVYSIIGNKDVSMGDLYAQFMEDRNKSRGITVFEAEKLKKFSEAGFGDFVNFRKERSSSGVEVDFEVIIPAWSSNTSFGDLSAVGFNKFDRVLIGEQLELENKQVTVAKYHKTGFEAASVTSGMFMATSMPIRIEKLVVQVDYRNPFLSVVFYEPPIKHQLKRHPEFKVSYDWMDVPLFVHMVNEADSVT